jgi:hypothetical protein
MRKTLRHGEARKWRVRFEVSGLPSHTFELNTGPRAEADRHEIMKCFRLMVREAIARGGCREFSVGVHEGGEDCDHEVG